MTISLLLYSHLQIIQIIFILERGEGREGEREKRREGGREKRKELVPGLLKI